MKGGNMWHGMVGMALIAAFFGVAGFVAYLLYGPPIPYWPLGNPVQATSTSETVPSIAIDLSGEEGTLLRCDGGMSLKAAYGNKEVRLALSDGRKISLPQTSSASGVYYANTDESFVFWNNGTAAFVGENGSVTYAKCVASGV